MTEEKEKEGNHTIFFTNNDADEAETLTDLKKPRDHHHVLVYAERLRRESCQ